MNEKKKLMILGIMSDCPVVSTEHIATLFQNAQPGKRASEALLELEEEKLIEGKRRGMGQAKVWRLSKKGREVTGITRPPVPLTSNKVEHYLAIADTYLELQKLGMVKRWRVELREEFSIGNRKKLYCPDAFFILQVGGKAVPVLLEVQRSPLTSTRWGEKWAVASAFMDSPDYPKASFQFIENKIIKPRIVVVSTQQPETVQGGSRLPLIIVKDIKKAPLV